MVQITSVHMSPGGTTHEHIASVRWVNPDDRKTGENTRAQMVDWIDKEKGKAIVSDGRNTVSVGTVHPERAPSYIRTYADGKWIDNLLALPRY